jgi:periplasmic protein TonB
MIFVVHAPEATRCAPAARVLALVALTWTLVGCPAGSASADACAYASTGPDGTVASAYAGGHDWPAPPPCPEPTPTPTPTPTPPPPPKPSPPKPTPRPAPRPTPKPSPKPQPKPPARAAPAPPAPRPTPVPTPTPKPKPTPTPRPLVTPVSYPAYHPRPTAHTAPDHSSPVTYVLLITVPAIVAVAALRPR